MEQNDDKRRYLCHEALQSPNMAEPYRAQFHIILATYSNTEYHLHEARKIVRRMEQIVASAPLMNEDLEMMKAGIENVQLLNSMLHPGGDDL